MYKIDLLNLFLIIKTQNNHTNIASLIKVTLIRFQQKNLKYIC